MSQRQPSAHPGERSGTRAEVRTPPVSERAPGGQQTIGPQPRDDSLIFNDHLHLYTNVG